MDIVFIIGIIMSIISLIIAYDSISGEKESGLLKLILTYSSRKKVLLGKWLGGFLSIIIILSVTLLGAILIAYFMSQVIWNATEWITLFAFFILSVLYCVAFYTIGFYISSKTKNSSDSIILSLLLWVIFILVIPTIPKYAAEIIYPSPSVSKIQYEIFFILKLQMESSIMKLKEPFRKKGLSEEDINKILRPQIDKIISDYDYKAGKLKKSITQDSKNYEMITALLHFFSPYSSYILASTELTATGAANQINFRNNANFYTIELFKFIQKKENEEKLKNPDFKITTKEDLEMFKGIIFYKRNFIH